MAGVMGEQGKKMIKCIVSVYEILKEQIESAFKSKTSPVLEEGW